MTVEDLQKFSFWSVVYLQAMYSISNIAEKWKLPGSQNSVNYFFFRFSSEDNFFWPDKYISWYYKPKEWTSLTPEEEHAAIPASVFKRKEKTVTLDFCIFLPSV